MPAFSFILNGPEGHPGLLEIDDGSRLSDIRDLSRQKTADT